MNEDKSINLNTRNITSAAADARIIKTLLKRVSPSDSRFAVLELSTKAVKLLFGRDVEAIRKNIENIAKGTDGVRFDFGNFFRTSDKVEAGMGLNAHNVMDMRYFSSRVLRSIQDKKRVMLENSIDTVYTVATAAYRTAANREEILDLIRDRTKINVRILSKKEEAEATLFAYTFTSAYRARLLHSPVIMIDQGGGSTEVSVFKSNNLVGSASINLGTTALFNYLFQESNDDTPVVQAFRNNDRKIKERLVTFYKNMSGSMSLDGEMFCVSVGSAITKATGRKRNADQHDMVLNREFIIERVAKAERYLVERAGTVGELRSVLPKDGCDSELTVRLGLPMYLTLMEKYKVSEIHVSGTGLWYGIYLQRLLGAIEED